MNNKIKKGLSYFSLFILALSMLPLGNILADEKVEPTKFVIEQNNLEANGFKIANDRVLTSEDVVKLSNVKSVDNLVDVNTLTVSDDQLANVNQVNPDGGLFQLTLTNGQQATITIPVVKEGSLVTANSKGALIFKNLALSQEATTKEKVLEEAGAYSVAFNNGYENKYLTVDFKDGIVTVSDNNLDLSKELATNNGAEQPQTYGSNQSLGSKDPNLVAATDPNKAYSLQQQNIKNYIDTANVKVDVNDWNKLRTAANKAEDKKNTLINITSDFELQGGNININKSVGTVVTINGNGHTIRLNGKNSGGNTFTINGNVVFNFVNVKFVGKLPQDIVSKNQVQTYTYQLPYEQFDIVGANTLFGTYGNSSTTFLDVSLNNVTAWDGEFPLFSQSEDNSIANFYGVNVNNVYGREHWGTFLGGGDNAELNLVSTSVTNTVSDWSCGPISLWEGENPKINLYSGKFENNYTKSNNDWFAITTETLNHPSVTGGYKFYPGFSIRNNKMYDWKNSSHPLWEKNEPMNITQDLNANILFNPADLNKDNVLGFAQNYIFYNLNPNANYSLGQDIHVDLDSVYNDGYRKPIVDLYGGIPLGEIVYTDENLAKKYENNGVAEGISLDWNDSSNCNGTISSSKKYHVEEKQINGKNYIVLIQDGTGTSNGKSITAQDLTIKQNVVPGNSDLDAKLKEMMHVNAIENGNSVSLEKVQILYSAGDRDKILSKQVGKYDITFSYKDITTTATLTIIDNNMNMTPDGRGWVSAENGKISSSSAKTLTNINDLVPYLKAKGQYDSKDATVNGIPRLSLSSDQFESIKQGTTGTYSITVTMDGDGNAQTTENQISTHVNLVVYNEGNTNLTPDGRGSISANNAVLTVSQAKALADKNALIAPMGAKAEYDGNAVDVTVNDNNNFANIKAGKVNTDGYKITFCMDADKNASTTGDNQCISKLLYVVDDNTSVTPDKKGFITSEEIWFRSEDAKTTFVEDKFIYDNMYGKAIYDGQVYPYDGKIVKSVADLSSIRNGVVGDYDVAFNLSIEGQTVQTAKKLHVVPDTYSVTPDRFGYVSGLANLAYTSNEAKQTFKGMKQQDVLKLLNVSAQYKGQDKTSSLSLSIPYWASIKKGVVNEYGYDVVINLGDSVPGTTLDEIVKTSKIVINIAKGKVDNQVTFDLDRAKTYNTIGSKTEQPRKDLNIIEYGAPNPLGGNLGGIHGTDTAITVEQAKALVEPGEFGEATDIFGVNVSINNKPTITPYDGAEYIDPNMPEIMKAVQSGQPGQYIFWVYSKINPPFAPENSYFAEPVMLVVMPENSTNNQEFPSNGISWAQIDAETVYKQEEAKNNHYATIKDLANTLGLVSKNHVNEVVLGNLQGDPEFHDVEPTLEFVDKDGNRIPDQDAVLQKINNAEVGDYYIKTTTTSPAGFIANTSNTISTEVIATATGKLSIVNSDLSLTANDFVVNVDEAKQLNDSSAKDKANLTATIDSNDAKEQVNVNSEQLQTIQNAGTNNQVGSYPLTFELNGLTEQVTVSVTNSDTAIDQTNSLFLHATGFEMPLDQAATLTADTAKTKANVKAWNKDGADLTANVQIEGGGLDAIKAAKTPGAYKLTFTVTDNGKTVNKPVFVSLTDANTVCKGDVCITAHDFKYELAKKAELTDDKQKELAEAKAWNKKTGESINVTLEGSQAVRDAATVGGYKVTATAQDVQKPFIINLYDGNTVNDDTHFLKAENVSMPLNQASALTNDTIKEKAKVKAWEAKTGNDVTNDVTVDQAQLDEIKAATKPGAYPLTFTIGNVNKQIVVSLTDANTVCDGNVCIAANSFTQNLTDVAQLDEAEAIKKAEATAWYTDSVDQKPTVKVNQEQLANIQKTNVAKVFPLTFTTVENPNVSKEVNVTVTDNNFELTANNFTINLATAKKYTATQLIQDTGATAVRKDNSGNGTVVVKDGLDAINQATKAGLFPVTLSVKEDANTTKQVFITVTDENTVVGDKAAITAKNFKLKLNTETASLTADTAKIKAEADAWYLDGHTPKPTINVNEAQLNAIKAAKEVGVMDLTFTVADDAKATRTVKVSIYDDNTVISPDESKFLHAKDFTITDEEAKALTEATAKDKAGVKAWNADGTDLTPNVKADATQLAKIKEGVVGKYPLKFTVDGLEKTVNVNVTDKNTVCEANVCITAHNFQKAIPAGLTETTAKKEAEVKAWYTDNTPGTPNVTVNKAQLDAINAQPTPIVLPLGFSAETATKQVFVTLTDDNSVVDNDELLDANNFTVNLKDVPNADFVQLANAKAWSTIDGTPVKVKLVSSKPTTVGYHDVTFATDKGTTITVKANVVDDATVCTENTCITAQDFNYNLTQAKDLTEAIAKDQAQVKAWYVNGKPGTPTVKADPAMLKDINNAKVPGKKPLKWTVVEDTANQGVQINVNLIDDNYTLTADNIQVNENEKPITAQQVINKSHATATNNKTQAPGTVVVSPEELDKINNTDKGVIDVTLSVQEQPEVTHTIKVNIVPEGAVVGDKATINAHDFEIKLSKVNKLDDATAKQLAGAEAWYNDGSGDAPIIVNQEQLKAIKNATKGQVLPLTFTVDGDPKATKTIQVTIRNDKEIILPGQDNKPGTNDDVVVKPNPDQDGNYPDKNPDGSVTLPDGGEITIPGTGNDDTTIAPPGSTIKPDGTIKPENGSPVLPDPNGGVELPGQDGDINNKPDNPLVKPDGDGPITVNPDGSVTLPNDENGTVTFPHNPDNNDTTHIPGGSTVKPDGTVQTPDGNHEVRPNPEGGVELPGIDGSITNKPQDNPVVDPNGDGEITVNPDGSVTTPQDGTITFPNGNNDDVTTFPGGSTIKPDGTVTTPNGNEVRPNPEGGVELPGIDGSITNKPEDNPVVKPQGNGPITINPDGSVTLPNDENGTVTFPNGNNDDITNIPGGSTVKPDGTVTTPNGNEVRPNPEGGVELPGNDGSITNKPQDNPVVKPQGNGPITVNPDGSVTLPNDENGTITYPNNPNNNGTVTVPNGSKISPNGQITVPGQQKPTVDSESDGTLKVPGPNETLGDKDDVVVKPAAPGDATITPEGGVLLPNGGSIVPEDGNGKEWPIPSGTVVNPNGSITLPGTNPDITFKPTIRPNGDGTISVPGPEGTFEPDGKNDFVVSGNGITFDPQTGNITMPNGGTVTLPGGQVENVPNGTIVLPDGTIIIPGLGMNNAPTITIVDPRYNKATNTINLKANEAFDPQKMATASDVEDGDLTAQLTITITRTKANVTGNVDTSIAPSEWQATLSVTDKQGATTKKVVNIKVLNTAKPVINGVKDQEITVGTAFDPMAGVTATQGAQDITNLVQVSCKDPNGKVTPTFNSMIIGVHTVTYTVTTEDGQTVSATATITVKPIILPGQDNKPGTNDDVIVTPNPEGKPPVINPDGGVTLPDGGETEFPEGGGVVTPPGSTIKPDGEITPPGGSPVLPLPPTENAPGGQIELPGDDGNINTKPDNPVITPQGPNKPSINPDGSVTLPDGGDINYPHNPDNPGGTITTPPGSVVTPDGTVQTPGGGQVDTDESGSIVLPGQDGNLGTNDDVQVNPGGNGDVTINPDGSVTVPNGGTITFPNNPDNNNEITVPNGSIIGQNGQVTPPGANAKPVLPNANGTITIPGADGQLGTPDDGIVTPNGNSTINPDGSITLPGGGTVDLPGECHLTVEPGGVVLPNGAVINPGANGVLDTPGYAPQAPSQPGNGQQTPGTENKPVTRAMANNEPANQGQQNTTNQPTANNVNDDVYLDPAIVCATPVTKPTAKPQTPTGAASQVVLYATIIAAAVGAIVVIRRNRK